ncbi:hypothetical protein Cgig2_019348 [Carnegiea gigantea]|uniref:Uncharacterized protein n=1 Tax=Carnegiea gigantea TaxID=171969 RepID=A0A9Q1Q7H1_9CARY|nr:hypothetical protein Cgig2_019348 [Carnegiea gigantea]
MAYRRYRYGVDSKIGAVKMADEAYARFLQIVCIGVHNLGQDLKIYVRAPANLDEMKAVFHGKHAIGEMSFSPAIIALGSHPNRKDQNVPTDLEEHMGYNDEADEDVSNEAMQFIPMTESRCPPRSAHNSSQKHRSEDAQVQNALNVLRIREKARAEPKPSICQQVLTNLREHPGGCSKGTNRDSNGMGWGRGAYYPSLSPLSSPPPPPVPALFPVTGKKFIPVPISRGDSIPDGYS